MLVSLYILLDESSAMFNPSVLLCGDVERNPGPKSSPSDVGCERLTPVLTPSPTAVACESLFPAPGFTVLHLNIRSLYQSLHDLREVVHQCKPDVMALSETWLDDSISDMELALVNYNLYFKVQKLSQWWCSCVC